MRRLRPANTADRRLWEIQPVRDVAALAAIIAILWLVFDLRHALAPVFIALVLAYACDPMIQTGVDRTRLPRWLFALLLTLVLVAAIALLLTWLGPAFLEQMKTLGKNIPQYAKVIEDKYGVHIGGMNEQLSNFAKGVSEAPAETLSPLFTGTSQAMGILGAIVSSLAEIVLSGVLLPIFFFLLTWHFPDLRRYVRTTLEEGGDRRVPHMLGRMDQAVSAFVRGRLLIAAISAGAFALGWSVTGVPYALLLGLLTGLLTIVPYLSTVGWPIALLAKYIDVLSSGGSGAWTDIVLWPSVVFMVVAFAEGWVLTPWIQSETMEMSALVVLIAVIVGGAVGGALGMLLAIPVTACCKILLEELWKDQRRLAAVPQASSSKSTD
jgi:predicted PurR-regulated permease PerM